MQVQLTITESPSLDSESLRRFIALAKRKGKTPEVYLTELIASAVSERKPARKQKGGAK